jgi:hypothetical protein
MLLNFPCGTIKATRAACMLTWRSRACGFQLQNLPFLAVTTVTIASLPPTSLPTIRLSVVRCLPVILQIRYLAPSPFFRLYYFPSATRPPASRCPTRAACSASTKKPHQYRSAYAVAAACDARLFILHSPAVTFLPHVPAASLRNSNVRRCRSIVCASRVADETHACVVSFRDMVQRVLRCRLLPSGCRSAIGQRICRPRMMRAPAKTFMRRV